MSLHSELDLMCVAPAFRGRGVGAALIGAIEEKLRERGVRVWFGNVTRDLQTERLRKFYGRHGFAVLPDGQPLPALLGRDWSRPAMEQPAFFFYKQLRKAA